MLFIALNVSSGLRNKFVALQALVQFRKPDFMVVSETGLRQQDLDVDRQFWCNGIPNYTGYHIIPDMDAAGRTRKGMSMWIRDAWTPKMRRGTPTLVTDLNLIHVVINTDAEPMHIIGIYGEPDMGPAKDRYWERFSTWFAAMGLEDQRTRCIVIGDCNVAPNPAVDRHSDASDARLSKAGEPFRRLLARGVLCDVWRVHHPNAKAYTWSRKVAEIQQSSRIDLALTSERLVDKSTSTILDMVYPLCSDHVPIELEVRRPRSCRDIPDRESVLPEIPIRRFKVRELKDPLCADRYKQRVEESAAHERPDMDLRARYTAFSRQLYAAGEAATGTRERRLNAPREIRPSSSDEYRAALCHTVYGSRHTLLPEVARGEPLRETAAIKALLRTLPVGEEIQDPSRVCSVAEAEQWFDVVRERHEMFARRADKSFRDERLETVLGYVAQNDDLETSRPRSWYGKVKALCTLTKYQKRQTFVTEEIDPVNVGAIRQSGTDVKEAIRRFWADLFRDRRATAPRAEPWFSEAFRERRRSVPERSRSLVAPITEAEVTTTIAHLRKEKACGADDIPAELLQHLPESAITRMTGLLNEVLRTKIIPTEWTTAKVYTLHKGGDPSKCSNYRPISLLSVPYKVFTTILTKRLTRLTESENLFANCQGGFRKQRSCIDKIALLTGRILETQAAQGETHIAFIDVKKAYDSVPHDRLLHTLRMHGICPEFVDLVNAIYTGTTASVITPFGDTETFPLSRGVRQGCPMSPVLFNLVLEPLLEWLSDTAVSASEAKLAFADDIALLATDHVTLQGLVDRVSEFFAANRLELGIAADKSAYMTSNPRHHITVPEVVTERGGDSVTLRATGRRLRLPRLTGTQTYRYLGVHLNVELNWDYHLDRLSNKLTHHLFCIRQKSYTKRQVVKILNGIVIPYMTYGLECVEVPLKRVSDWQSAINKLVNRKGGLPWNASAHLNYLPVTEGGEGLVCIADRIEQLQLQGLFRHGLHSVDTDTAEVITRLTVANNHKLNCFSFKRAWHQLTSELVAIHTNCHRRGLPEGSLERVFADLRIRSRIRQLVHVDDWRAVITPDGSLSAAVSADDAIVGTQVCVGTSLRIQPMVLHSLGHPHAINGVVRNNAPIGPISVWTDASKQPDGRVGFGVYWGNGDVFNHPQRIEDGAEVFDGECRAACFAILMHDPTRHLDVYSDCESVVRALNNLSHTLPHHPVTAEWLRVARLAMAARNERGMYTRVHHVYSHLLDKPVSERTVVELERFQKMQAKFGGRIRTLQVLYGNQIADQIAQFALTLDRAPPLVPETPEMPRFLLIKRASQTIIGNAAKFIGATRQHGHRQELLAHQRSKFEWLTKPGVDWKRSAALACDPRRSVEPLQRHAMKSKHGFLGSKSSRWEHRNEPYFRRIYEHVVRDPYCDLCRMAEGVPIPDTKHHYLFCVAHAATRADTTRRILVRINRNLVVPISATPNYWNADEKRSAVASGYTEAIESEFGPIDAAMGLVPQAWTAYLKSLTWHPRTNLEDVIHDCQTMIIEGFLLCWKERTRKFYATHALREPEPEFERERQPDEG